LDPCDQDLRNEDRAFLLGDDILVITNVAAPNDIEPQTEIAIPKNHVWYDFDLDGVVDENLPQMKIRAGSLVVTQQVKQFVGEKTAENQLVVYVALDKQGSASGQLYVDAGDGYQHLEGGYRLINFLAELKDGQLTLSVEEEGGMARPDYDVQFKIIASGEKKVIHDATLLSTQNQLSFPIQF